MEFNYITKNSLNAFIFAMDNIKTEHIIEDPNINDLLQGKNPNGLTSGISVYELAESFLYLFQERENYELCQQLINGWPQLKKQ